METELTKKLKRMTHGFKPKLNSNMRTIRWADEVWTPTGIVDSIRFEDYYEASSIECPYLSPKLFSDAEIKRYEAAHRLGQCFRNGALETSEKRCRGCVFAHRRHVVGMMCTCYEVKITLDDFKSEHGHNFHGNENYYVVPAELASKIENLIPDDVGIIIYKKTEKFDGLRTYKKSGWREVPQDTMVSLLYNALKKWCDNAVMSQEGEKMPCLET